MTGYSGTPLPTKLGLKPSLTLVALGAPKEYSIAEAKARLSALVEQAARGEAVTLTRRGKPVARIVPADELNPKPKLDLAVLKKFRASLPRSRLSSVVMVSKMRDEADGW
jgi:prevent-host-death family protein